MRPINVAIALITLTASARAVEQNEVPTAPVVAPAIVLTDTAPIEAPPLPRPRPALRDAISDNPVALISAFRQQHGEGPVAISPALTRIAQEPARSAFQRAIPLYIAYSTNGATSDYIVRAFAKELQVAAKPIATGSLGPTLTLAASSSLRAAMLRSRD